MAINTSTNTDSPLYKDKELPALYKHSSSIPFHRLLTLIQALTEQLLREPAFPLVVTVAGRGCLVAWAERREVDSNPSTHARFQPLFGCLRGRKDREPHSGCLSEEILFVAYSFYYRSGFLFWFTVGVGASVKRLG
jgi:hypothetical protein